ncbi:spore coat protein [Anaerocolumna sp. AGMB13020]|uniref:spore coat protein n=1 Tax=Anaerocolumna sp. AGMB13020 TaxID=3081750 RepID=UPI002952E9AE|nr:spore coat protein [Anaerocolumna sp. AGMB13020]WOO36205.1 spore coat protein [Anaerocolumna sp. AGMB13020]
MQEQAMVTDALSSINAGLKSLGDMISQAEDQELRQTLQQMRNDAETCQHELYTIAKNKNYYPPSQKATEEEITNLRNIANQTVQSSQSGQAAQGMR